jgi:hypothetical protein
MRGAACLLVLLVFGLPAEAKGGLTARQAEKRVKTFVRAVEKINDNHCARPGDTKEAELAAKLPRDARKTLDFLLKMEDGEAKWDALAAYGAAAADLDLAKDLARIEKALENGAPGRALAFGHYVSRDRFLLRALRVEEDFAEQFADAIEGVMAGFDKMWGFAEFSKVPGKKLRVLLHGESDPKPPHFAPQFPWHSEVDFPVHATKDFVSPAKGGRFEFYGIGHELGHVVAMWGSRSTMEDHHAWAHYTGVTMVDACSKAKWAKKLKDKQWRSLEKERKNLEDQSPGLGSQEEVLRLLIDLHDLVGPKRIGAALNLMESKRWVRRINHVRYYTMEDFEKALLAGKPGRKKSKQLKKLFADAR